MSSSIARRIAASTAFMALAAVVACAADSPIQPPPPAGVASVAVTPPSNAVVVGQQVTLQATPKNAAGQALERVVTWTSENVALATVSDAGVVTTLAVGEVGIRATSEGKFGRAVLTIAPVPPVPVAEVRLSADDEIVLAWDGQTTITARALDAQGNELQGRTITWQSNRTSVAAVNHGTIYAISSGTATITASSEGVVAQVGVRVNEAPVTALKIVAVTEGLEVGDVLPFAAEITRANGQVLYGPADWSSNAPGVLRVEHSDFTGATLAAVAEGEATLTIAKDGVTASRTLRVAKRAAADLIYNRWLDAASEIFVLGLQSEGLVPLKLNAGNVSREPSPSPDGTRFVFAVSQTLPNGETQNDLYVVNRDGMNMRWLTRTQGVEHQPQWHPGGGRILFHSAQEGQAGLFTINVDGTGTTRIASSETEQFSDMRDASWSADGAKIVFIGVRDSRHKVYTMNADGTNVAPVTTDAGYDEYPTFSPDGQTIAFTRYNAADPTLGDDLMIVSAQGGAPTRYALPGHQRNPAWSPDGELIAFNGTATMAQATNEIYTIRPDGSGLRLRTINPAWGGGWNPAWIARQ